ncbi:hypothetical protein KAI52_02565 [Candidatus Parcubacteria bacterium]|nr:hypothetical protein [Candidatus Parcubacteria bacterium]
MAEKKEKNRDKKLPPKHMGDLEKSKPQIPLEGIWTDEQEEKLFRQTNSDLPKSASLSY